MASELSLEIKYENILSPHGIKDKISKVIIEIPKSLVGEHAGSICEFVTVHFENKEIPPLELFLKRIFPGGEEKHIISMGQASLNEGNFLVKIVSEMDNLCIKKLGVNNDIEIRALFPKTYFADKSEIVMENISIKGYYMRNKTELQNFEMAKYVLQTLAKMHGVSYCLIQQNGGTEAFLKNNPNYKDCLVTPTGIEMMVQMFEPPFQDILKILEDHKSKNVEETFKKLKSYKGNLISTLIDVLSLPSIIDVVNHGDCWNNNMMFSPETKEHPELAKLVFVDFQLPRINSPCPDISYYLFTSVKTEVRLRSKELLQIYFDTLSNLVKKLGHDFPFTFEMFLVDYGIKSKYGFLLGLVSTIGQVAMGSHDSHKTGIEQFGGLMTKWIRENPDKVDEIVHNVMLNVKEFEMFGTV